MKRFTLLFVTLFLAIATIHAQSYKVPDYNGYRSFDSFNRDTAMYLQYNWGWKTGGWIYENTTAAEFFDKFELPIKEIEIRCTTPGGIAQVACFWLWLIPHDKAFEMHKADLYCIFINAIMPDIDKHSMLYEDLKPHIPEIEPDCWIVLPWKESYREALGPFIVRSIQHNYLWEEDK